MQSQFFKSWKKSMRWPKGDFRQEKHEIGEEHQNQEADIERKEEKPEAVIKTEENTEEVCESIKQKGDFRMCRDALFCDGTSSYVIPPEPAEGQRIRLRFRTARNNVSTVLLVADSGIYQMERVLTRGVFDYYEISWKLGSETFSYYFEIRADEGDTSIFIYPGYQFKVLDGLITNFHLPESTLIMLVSAFAGYEHTMQAYRTAVAEKYRFFSFGDAMLIL